MKDAPRFGYFTIESSFGDVIVVWSSVDNKIVRIFLSKQQGLFASSVYKSSAVEQNPGRAIRTLCSRISALLRGQAVDFNLRLLDWSQTYHFQKRVLRLEHRIPRGLVSTYGRLAIKLGNPGAPRAVGTALARNQFPLIIPCHRVVRSDGTLGGYAGGLTMKKRLLEFEGVQLDKNGRLAGTRLW